MKELIPIIALCAIAGCGDTLYVAHDTVVGINANVSANRQQGQVVIGYDRDFAAVVPVMEPDPTSGSTRTTREAMAVFGCTRMETRSIFLTRYSDVISTGESAGHLAKALGKNNNSTETARLVSCGEKKDGNSQTTGGTQQGGTGNG